MKKLDLSLYLVANRGQRSDESFLNHIKQALKGGVSIVQLREKELGSREFFELGLKLKRLCDEFKVPLIINDRVDIALALDASGVHLGQEDLECSLVRRLLGEDKIIGVSVKNLTQLQGLKGVDYLGCGAIKSTPTKQSSLLSLQTLVQITQKSPVGVVAIGGIDEEVLKELRGIKLSGVAVVRAIMDATKPYEAALNLKKLVYENLSLK